jgi:acyl-CoA synthetase (AMP-forming)/AMP-acid ligase II
MSETTTIRELLKTGRDDAIAISAPDQAPLTYAGLREHTERTVRALNLHGIGRNDRVAIVLPNGPVMASAFVSIAAGATTAPLNPAYKEDEFRFYLSDLGAKALVVEEGSTSPALKAAEGLGIRVLEVVEREHAGAFEFVSDEGGETATAAYAEADDVALVLHTSGTTARPKIVPLSQRNVCASAGNIHARGQVHERHAAIPYSRPDRDDTGNAANRCLCVLHARIQCTEIFLVAGRIRPELVFGCADDASGDTRSGE